MRLVAKTPCVFGGRQFYIGDVIPDGLVLDPKGAEGMGLLAIMPEAEEGTVSVSVPVLAEEGVREMPVVADAVAQALLILQMDAKRAAQEISGVTDPDVLMLLDLTEHRKEACRALKERRKADEAMPEGGDVHGEDV